MDNDRKEENRPTPLWHTLVAAVVGGLLTAVPAMWLQSQQLEAHAKEARRTEGLAAISQFLAACDARIGSLVSAEIQIRAMAAAGPDSIPFFLSDAAKQYNAVVLETHRAQQALRMSRTFAALTLGETAVDDDPDVPVGSLKQTDVEAIKKMADGMAERKRVLQGSCTTFGARLMDKVR